MYTSSAESNSRGGQDDLNIPCIEQSDAERLCKHPMVSVLMTTYNHECFIRQAIEGVLMQETDFEYEFIIGEDCSQDRTREICFEYQKRYPDKIRVLWSETNLNHVKGNGRRVRAHARGKYVACCEGDDYWTDSKKLQKQVEYMESHLGCAGCFHERVTCSADGLLNSGTGLPNEMKRVLTGDDIAVWVFPCPPTCTVMYRRAVYVDRPKALNTWFGGDRATALWAAYSHGTVDWVEGVKPSVYRIHSGGVCRGRDELFNIIQDQKICRETLDSFPVSRWARRIIHEKMCEQTFRAWWKWHGSESEETRKSVRHLLKDNTAIYPALRWRLWARQTGYRLNQGYWRAWHGVVMGIKRVLPGRLYGWLREGGRKWKAGGET